MASTLYENGDDYQLTGGSRDVEHDNDEVNDLNPKQLPVTDTAAMDTDNEKATMKENGNYYNGVNGNGVHGDHNDHEDDGHNGEADVGSESDEVETTKHNGDTTFPEIMEDEPAAPVPYYGRTLVAPEYMNYQLSDDVSHEEENDFEDTNGNDDEVVGSVDDAESDKPEEGEENASGEHDQRRAQEEEDIALYKDGSEESASDDVGHKNDRNDSALDEEQGVRQEGGGKMVEALPRLAQPEEDDEQNIGDEREVEENEEDEGQEINELKDSNEGGIEGDVAEKEKYNQVTEDMGITEGDEVDGESVNSVAKQYQEEAPEKEESNQVDGPQYGDESEGEHATRGHGEDGEEDVDEGEYEDVIEQTQVNKVEKEDDADSDEDETGLCAKETGESDDKIEEEAKKFETQDEEADEKQNVEDYSMSETAPSVDVKDETENEEMEVYDLTSRRESTLEHWDSLKGNVSSPTRDITEVESTESLNEIEVEQKEDDDGDQDVHTEEEPEPLEESSKETVEHGEESEVTTNGPVEVYDEEQIEQEDEETVESDKESSQGDDSGEHDRELHEDETTMGEVEGEDEVELDPISEVEDADVERGNGDEEGFVVQKYLKVHEDESDLTGRVKELGRMFEGGGPMFPKSTKNDKDKADGTPVSVRKFKAMFEQDRHCAERARETGRKEESSGPPRGMVKNLRGLFENPEGFEARKG